MTTHGEPRKPAVPVPILLALGAGVAALVLALIWPAEGWSGILAGGLFGICITLGAAAVAAVSLLCGARWWDGIRRVFVALMSGITLPLAITLVAVVAGIRFLYPWAIEAGHLDALVASKVGWLNVPFFMVRTAVVVVLWVAIIRWLAGRIRNVEAHGDAARPSLIRTSVVFTIVFAVTISVAFCDWGMSLEPEWFSSIYGVYGFAAAFKAGIAGLAIVGILAARRGLAGSGMRPVAGQTLGALLFAFAMFWGYIWLSQYLLIWYADLPEESVFYLARLGAGWSILFWLNPVLNFAIPFAVLMPAGTKKHPFLLLQVANLSLVGLFVDMLLLTGPAVGPLSPVMPVTAGLVAFACVIGIGAGVRKRLQQWDGDVAKVRAVQANRESSPVAT